MKKIMSLFLISCMLVSILISFSSCKGITPSNQKEKYSSSSFEFFDTVTLITGYADSKAEFDAVSQMIMTQLKEYHRLFTIYNSYTGLNNLCVVNRLQDGVHLEVEVDDKILDFIEFCKEMYTITNGKNNVAMGSVLSIWHNYREEGLDDPIHAELPPQDKLVQASEHTSIEDIIINRENHTIFLADPNMRLDVGAIAKGYAVEKIAESLEAQGITGYCLNVGGNVRTIGVRGDGTQWRVGIENPNLGEDPKYLQILGIEDQSLVISGSYQRYYIVNGKSYHHIIDPVTLQPASYYKSLAIVTHSSALADALSTALFCMPYEEASALVESMDNVEAYFILVDDTEYASSGFHSYVLP